MRRLLIALALAAGVITPAASAVPAAAQEADRPPPGVGIRLLDAPVATKENPRTRVYITDHLPPGKVIERRVEISNGDDASSQISVYPAAADIQDGAFKGAKGSTQNELSGWVTVTPGQVTLGAFERATVNVKIAVPADASAGERYGVVWAQRTTTGKDGGITHIDRVGIRIYLSVGPGGAPPSDFDITSFVATSNSTGAPVVEATVRNTGKRALDLSAELRLTNGPGGLSAGPYRTTSARTLGLGESGPVTLALDPQLPKGPWQAKIDITSGLVTRSANATLTFPDATTPATTAPANNSSSATLWAAIAAALILLLLASLLILHRHKRQNLIP